jgi:hypothetical protein
LALLIARVIKRNAEVFGARSIEKGDLCRIENKKDKQN